MAERDLFVAILTQAFRDLQMRGQKGELAAARDWARSWLLGSSKWFQEVCMWADMEPVYVEKQARKVMVNPNTWRAAPGEGKYYIRRQKYRQRKQLERQSKCA